MKKYNHSQIEKKWQKYWQTKRVFAAKDFSKKKKKFVLVEFPYPSGAGLHMGHLRPYVAADVYSRFYRSKGFETLFPIGWDAFGLPAENYAIKMGVHPSKTTAQNIKNAKRQIESWGLSFDWSREINTTDPNYYKWTQWIFLQFYKKGLAYEATGLINWCPKDKTGLANGEVIDGKCERCGTVVVKKELRQWYFRITKYAEKLLEGLKHLPEWPEPVKLQQENWIGKSTGAEIDFEVNGNGGMHAVEKPNFLLLHGWEGSPNRNFFPWLKSQLEAKGFEVQTPALPHPKDPVVAEQVEYILNNCKIDSNTVIVGHSFGGVVAMKLVEKLRSSIRSLVLAASFVENRFKDGSTFDEYAHDWKFDFNKIKKNSGQISYLCDVSDSVVFEDQADKIETLLGAQVQKFVAQEPHICGKEEPVVLEALLPKIKVFTTRPDTIFGATYMVVAPEHPLIQNFKFQITNYKEVEQYIAEAKAKSERERSEEADKEKTGVELKGIKAINPATKQEIPVWVADYVLWGYGTGAIMAVPAHDERDFAFAKKFNLPIKIVVAPFMEPVKEPDKSGNYTDYGKLVESGEFTGLSSEDAIPKMAAAFGKPTTQYKLRDWVFSRQRYWGEPIPIIHCGKCGIVPVPENQLPVKLPPVKKYEPTGTGESPLASIKSWVNVKCPKCKGPAKRETNTMPQWAGSSWYWLRYTDPKDKKTFAEKKKQKYWTPVDVYFGGMEHTTLHLLYSRFWNLFLYDQKLVTAKEPYTKRVPHGIILGPDGEKMSKSRGNVVNPDDVVKEYGADTLRMYELFLGPHEATISWNDQGVVGVRRFLDRVWAWGNQMQNVEFKVKNESEQLQRAINKLIKKVTEDIEQFHFNTAISSFMEFYNQIKDEPVSKETVKKFLVLLSPFAPHISEELYQQISQSAGKRVNSIQFESWPKFDPKKLVESTVEIVVQVNGKVKGKVSVAVGSTQEQVQAEVMKLEQVNKSFTGEAKRIVYVPNKLINLVV